MEVGLIFKIAAGWNTCVSIKSGIKTQWQGGTGFSYKPCRTAGGVILDCTIHS